MWPLGKFRAAAATAAGAGAASTAVVLTTGGMNPPHRGHVQLLHEARRRLEAAGCAVVGLWLSPSHDSYVQPKAEALQTVGLSAAFRLELARCAVADDPLVAIGAWEASVEGFRNFPEVADALQAELQAVCEREQLLTPAVFYACGTDMADRCGLYSGLEPHGVVVVPRDGEVPGPEDPAVRVLVAVPAAGEVAGFSSTRVRAAIAAQDHGYLARALSPHAAAFLLEPTAEALHRFAADFRQL
mmetsp:Transcript_108145/g.334026  ORF Transcript_108145/g.334026 Transcript_108145/m.334026 type:complete len:243 (-) Transcript_108145:54-782(-)